MLFHDVPGDHIAEISLPYLAANFATADIPIFVAPYACTVYDVDVFFGSNIVGDNSNSFNLNLMNRGVTGLGTTEVDNVDYASGTNATANVAVALYDSTTGLSLAVGNVLAIQRELVGSGIALPPSLVRITYRGA